MTARYYDLAHRDDEPEEKQSSQEIKNRIVSGLRRLGNK